MKSRNTLAGNAAIRALDKIWGNQIRADYRQGILPNERTLQAAIYHYLRRSRPRLDVFVEITSFLGEKGDIPDLIITRNHRIEAVVELKFVSKQGIVYQRDIDKLVKWSRLVGPKAYDTLELEPNTMDWKGEKKNRYALGSFTTWVFAAIGHHKCGAFSEEAIPAYLEGECGKKMPNNFILFRGMVFPELKKTPVFNGPSLLSASE